MNDLIDRQAAIDAVNEYLRLSEVSKTVQNMTSIQAILKQLPTAEPKAGHWMWSVDEYGESWLCSECLSEYVAEEGMPTWARYCPNCGARMEGDTDATD